MKVKTVELRGIKGRKEINNKVYEYEYFTLPINVYVRKHVVDRWGKEFIVEIDDDTGVICIKPKKIGDYVGLSKCPIVPPRR